MSEGWYYSVGDEQIGPLSLLDLKQAIAKYPNKKQVFVWRAGFTDWEMAAAVPEIAEQRPPPLQPPIRRKSNKRGVSRNLAALICVIVAVIFLARMGDADHKQPSQSARQQNTSSALAEPPKPVTPASIVGSVINEAKANVQVSIKSGVMTVEYSLEPWALTVWTTKNSFLVHVKSIVPDVFAQFPEISVIQITGNGKFTDKKGNSSVDRAMYVKFSRGNSSTINWRSVSYDNILDIADAHWAHPAFSS